MWMQRDEEVDLDPVRLKVLKLVKDRKPATDMKSASIAIGRNAAYLHQFVFRGTPKVLSEDDREALAEHLGCKPEELKHKKAPPRKPRKKGAPKEGWIWSLPVENQDRIGKYSFDEWSPH